MGNYFSFRMVWVAGLLLVQTSLRAQADTAFTKTRADYLAKSKRQQTTGFILVGGGLAIAAAGILIQQNSNEKRSGVEGMNFTGGSIALFGGCVAAASIPLFISSGRNKRRSMISFSQVYVPRIQGSNWFNKGVPSLAWRVALARN